MNKGGNKMKSYIYLLLVFLALILVLPACSSGEADTHYNTGVEFQEQGKLPEAITEYDEVIRLDSKHILAYKNRGIAYTDLGQFERAIENYDRVLSIKPKSADAYYNRGFAYKEQGKKAEAIADFEKAITLTDNPQWIEIARQQIEELQSQ